MKVALVGPCSPRDLADRFFPNDQILARDFNGNRGIVVSSLAESLVDLGVHVTIISTASIPDRNPKVFRGSNLELRLVPQRVRPRSLALTFYKTEVALMLKELEKLDIDIVNAHWTYEYALAALKSGKPTLITAHDAPFTIFRYRFDAFRFFRLLMAIRVRMKTIHLSVVSKHLATQWSKQMFWKNSIDVIPNISPFSLHQDKTYTKNARNIVAVSEHGKLKNVTNLLRAFSLIVTQVPEAKLSLIGSGLGPEDSLAVWADSVGLSKSVSWLGYLNHDAIHDLLIQSDLFIHTSLEESFGLSILEAMSLGLPVVAGKNSGGVPETVENAGLLVDVKETREIAQAAIRLLHDANLRATLGKAGVSRARSVYSPDYVGKMYLNLFHKILKEKN